MIASTYLQNSDEKQGDRKTRVRKRNITTLMLL